jgi:hypothetical protein
MFFCASASYKNELQKYKRLSESYEYEGDGDSGKGPGERGNSYGWRKESQSAKTVVKKESTHQTE